MDTRKHNAPRAPVDPKTRLMKLEATYAHELMSIEERLELRERLVRLRRRCEGEGK
jgi:hypothetical protein